MSDFTNRPPPKELTSDATGLGRTRQKPELDFFLQAETRTRLFMLDPKKPEPDYETRPNPKGFWIVRKLIFSEKNPTNSDPKFYFFIKFFWKQSKLQKPKAKNLRIWPIF